MKSMSRIAALTAAGAVAAALAVAGPAAAAPNQYAPSIGTANGSPTTGAVGTAPRVVTSALCPTGTTAINGFVDSTDAGLVGAVAIAANTTDLAAANTTGIPFSFNLLDIAASQGKTLVNGTYQVSIVCLPDLFGTPATAQFDATFVVSGGASATVAGTTFTFQAPALPATTTTLSVSPAGPITQGASVTLTANVSATGATPAGTVQFQANGAAVGTPQTVTAGVATLTTTALPSGNPVALTAVFTPATPATTQTSTSNSVNLVVNPVPQTVTMTLGSAPAAPTTADVVTITAGLSSSVPVTAGSVSFSVDGGAAQAVAVSNGAATLQLLNLTQGSHTVSATYADTSNPRKFNDITTAVTTTFSVAAFAGASGSEAVTTTVGAGTITLTATGTVALGPLSLNSTNTLLVNTPGANADLNTVTVSDTRAGAVGYNVTGQVTDFTGPGTSKINGQNLGWTPKVLTSPAGGTITAGPVVAPANGVAAGDTGTLGLKSSRVLATAPAGAGFGTATYSATLALQAPTSTTAGSYSATLTLTAL